MSFVAQIEPLMISRARRFMKAAISLDGRVGALRERSRRRVKRDLVSRSISKTDLVELGLSKLYNFV